ncbi:MAG TPA: hypothetical protein VM575_06540 [Nocardioides sp.]|nr:hypothetical protein [Nocardioides sp.]
MEADLGDLLARGGWELLDPRPIAAEHPDTFELPTSDELARLEPGSLVRAMFRLADIADFSRDGVAPYDESGRPVLVTHVERMWAVVTGRDGDRVTCLLDNQPYATHTSLELFDGLSLPLSHLIATGEVRPELSEHLAFVERMAAEDERPAGSATPVDPAGRPRIPGDQQGICDRAGVRAEPPSPFGLALVARNVTAGGGVLQGARFEPAPERRDTGWVFFCGDDFETVTQTVGFDVVTVQEAARAHPDIRARLALPVGWAFSVGEGVDDLYEVELLE